MKKYILSGLIGFGISVGCLLPPFIHFVTGPLGPLIGGVAGGMKARANWNGALVIGITMGVCVLLLLILLGLIVISFRISLPGVMGEAIKSGSFSPVSFLKIAALPFSIVTILGTAGAFLGGKLSFGK